jgi:hypothetical protein
MTSRFDWKVTIDSVDVSQFIPTAGTIDHGRGSVFGGFSAPRATFDLFTEEGWETHPGTLPTVNPGDEVVITVTNLEHAVPYEHGRFTGKVQALEWSEMRLRVIAVGVVADWQQSLAFVPLEGFAAAKDDVRVDAWCDQSDPAQTIIVEGGGGRWLRAVEYGAQPEPLLDVLLGIAEDCDALLMQDRFGGVRYRTRYRTAPDRVTLPSDVVDRTSIDMVLEHGTMVNTAYVYYGADPQDYVIETDAAAITAYGVRSTTLTTELRFDSGARGKALTYIENNMNRWQIPDVTMVMALTDDTSWDLLMTLEEGDPVTLDDFPAGAPIASYDANVIGFTEVMDRDDYLMVLHLSYGLAAPDEDDGNWVEDGSITGGDETGTTVIDGRVYRWHKFTTDGDLTIDAGVDIIADVIAVAGGGGSGGYSQSSSNDSGSGGAGGLYDGPLPIASSDSPISVVIGAAGAGGAGAGTFVTASNGTNGGDTTVGSVIDLTGGGGGGGSARGGGGTYSGGAGQDGGSGGGGGEGTNASSSGGLGIDGQGTNGSGGTPTTAGGGGGLAVASTITGASVTYGVGGTYGTAPVANTGSGGGGVTGGTSVVDGQAGAAGVVIIRYAVTPGGGAGTAYVYDEDIPYDTAITYEEA